MLFLYDLLHYIGYFLIMIIFMVIAIITAKGKTAWIWYGIGAAFQFLGQAGNHKVASLYAKDTTLDWIIYVVILVVSAILIDKRHKNSGITRK